MLVASLMPAMPLPCANAEMFAASRRAARMICFFFNVFVIIFSVLCLRVGCSHWRLILVLILAALDEAGFLDLVVSVASRCLAVVDFLFSHVVTFLLVIHSRGC